MKKYAIGADIGGGHITTAAIDLTNASIVRESECRMHVNAQGDAESILSAWTKAINTSIEKAMKEGAERSSIKGIGIAMPGPFDYPNGISLINDPDQKKFLSLYKMNIREELAKRTGLEPANIRFMNDAECFLAGEVFGGIGNGSKSAIGITLGTGFGSAYYIDGKTEDANLWCAPFRGKKAEEFISTGWFIERYKELTGKTVPGVKDLADSVINKTDEDEKAKQVFDEFGETLREFLVPLVLKNNADTLIIGGNIALSWNLFIEPLKKELENKSPETRVVRDSLGEEAALMGGASLLK